MCTSHCSNEIIEAIIVALAQACPERAMGGWGRRLRIAIDGTDPRTGRRFIWHMFQARPGGGGSVAGDGFSTIGEWHSAGGIKFGSIEVAETRFPLLFETHEFRPGSGGDGTSPRRRTAATCGCAWRRRGRRAPTPRARAYGTAPAACWAGGTARRTTTRCWRPARRAPRKLASKEVGVVVPARQRAARAVGRRRRLWRSGRGAIRRRAAADAAEGLA